MPFPRLGRAPAACAAALVLALATAACGAGSAGGKAAVAAGSSSSAARPHFTLNPAETAALDIVRLQPVVPFTSAQVQQLVPMLQALAADPNQPASALTADGARIEAVFTSTQQEALKNMGSGTGPGFRFSGGAAGPGGSGGAFRGRSGTAGALRRSSAASGAGRRPFRSGSGAGGASFAYTAAINTLEGKAAFPGATAAGGPVTSA